jgi:hypothetical protein
VKTKIALFALMMALLFVGHPFSGRVVVGQAPFTEGTRPVLTADQAREWAQAWVQRKRALFAKWGGAAVGDPTVYFDLDGRPAVYAFSVLRSRQDVGHVIVSYKALPNPVLAFGKGSAPHLRCPTCVDEVFLARQGFKLAARNPIYLGPWDFFFEVEPLDALHGADVPPEGTRQLIPMGFTRPIAVVHQPVPQTWIDVPAETGPGPIAGGVADAATSHKIFGVADYDQFIGSDYGYGYDCASGCTPTAAANIVHFWDRAGYGGLAYADWHDTTSFMRTHMGTWCDASGGGATYTSDTSPGMIRYATDRGFDFSSRQYCWPGQSWLGCVGDASWSRYTSRIDRNHPVLISFQAEAYYDGIGHSVTGVGYDDDGGAYWIVRDNWPSTPEDVYVLSTAAEHRFYHTFTPPYRDTIAPSASISVPRYHYRDPAAPAPIPVAWHGEDDFSGVARYDVQYRQGSGEWVALYASTTYTRTTFGGQVGQTYTFRSRSYDWMGNVSEWATAESTVYAYKVAGRVTGNRGHAVVGAQVTAAPPALNAARPNYVGDFTLYFAGPAAVDLTASAPGFGSLFPMQGVAVDGEDDGLHLVLPPLHGGMANGHFEDGLQGWQVNHTVTPTVAANWGHTGAYALRMSMPDGVTPTVWQLTQTVSTAVITDEPTLSWFYVVHGTPSMGDRENQLWVQVRGEASGTMQPLTLTTTLPLTATRWTHSWFPLDDLAGRQVTLTFGLRVVNDTSISAVLLDEVSLGEGNEKMAILFLPFVAKDG